MNLNLFEAGTIEEDVKAALEEVSDVYEELSRTDDENGELCWGT